MLPRLVMQRALLGGLTLLVVSLLIFCATEVLPGDVAETILGQSATREATAVIREQLGLDRPAWARYLDWLSNLAVGDLGTSLATQRSIAEIVALRMPYTLLLAGGATLIAVPLSIALGLKSAMQPGSAFDRIVATATLAFVSAPEFLVATILVFLFAVTFNLFPATSYFPITAPAAAYLEKLVLPVLTLVAVVLAPMTRMTRNAVLAVLGAAYVEMAILKGVPRHIIILRHAFPNVVAPLANVVAVNLAYLITGVVVVEVVFSYPGMGKLMVDGVQQRDVPLIQACALFFCTIYIFFYIAADIASLLANPRLRHPK
jgi:peptide/nickel transport system permease protein